MTPRFRPSVRRSLASSVTYEGTSVSQLLSTATTRDEASRAASVAVLPIGSFEQHGEYLPLTTDTLIACIIARDVADACKLMLLPPISIACSHEHAAWPGTVSISARTLHQVVTDIADSLHTSGVDRLLLVNGHGGNYVLANIVQEASVHGGHMALFPTSADWKEARETAGLATDAHTDMHAGEIETSILLHAMPEVVRSGYEAGDHEADERRHLLTLGMRGYTATGVIGNPSLASAEKGKAVLDSLTNLARAHIAHLLAGRLP
jgi:creatinine amidohydrolase